jgi:hypothetical protein
MTLLKTLTGRLESLPERRRLKTLVGTMVGFNEKLTTALQQFAEAEVQEGFVTVVFSDDTSIGVASKRKKAATTARRLLKKLNASIDRVQESRSNVDVTTIVDLAESSRRGVRDRWQTLMKKKLTPYEKLIQVARNLKLPGAEALSDVMRRLGECVGQPPSNARRAQSIRDELEELRLAVQRLGFDDEAVRKFLVDAAAGTAGLKVPLDEEAVRQFLDKHSLWSLFKVSTR